MTASWWRVTVTAPSDQLDQLAAMIVTRTGNGIEERDGALVTTVGSEQAARTIADRMAVLPGVMTAIEPADPVDWTTRWRDGIAQRNLGRLHLTPSWICPQPSADQVVLTIDPESAFGSGEHGSTRATLRLLDRHLVRGARVLDLGSGSGIVAIAAALLGATSAIGIECDADAIPIADANAHRNGVEDRVRFLVGDAAAVAPLAGPADVVCSNILRTVNETLLPAIGAASDALATVIFSGLETTERMAFVAMLHARRYTVVDEIVDDNWLALAVQHR